MEQYYEQFGCCRQREDPACVDACPFSIDILDFQDKMARGKYDRAYKTYRNAVVFPDIVSRICTEVCSDKCPAENYGGAIQLKLLERTCVAKAKKKSPIKYSLPKKEKKIGIIGAGISGLTCGLRLAEKKYDVVLFEKEDQIGGQLKKLLPKDIYLAEFDLQMGKESYETVLGREVKSLEELSEYCFDAIYVATGKNGRDFGTFIASDGSSIMTGNTAVWGGGSLKGKNMINAIVDGKEIASAIDFYLKTGQREYRREWKETSVAPNLDMFTFRNPVIPTENGIFTDEEAVLEAGRCIRCQCNFCWNTCDLVAYYNKWPLCVKEEVAETVKESESMLRKAPATYLINTCTQCGLLEEVCPDNIQMGNMILQARKLLHKHEQMPPAFHGFWLDDMKHADGEAAKIVRCAVDTSRSEYVFFPGCNLGASDPRYVEKTYGWLVDNFSNMGIMLRCCGIHAEWAGDEELQKSHNDEFREEWEALGKPVLVTACPSCTKYLSKNFPEIRLVSIYELMCQSGKWPKTIALDNIGNIRFAIFDPCAARRDSGLQQAVRQTLQRFPINTAELTQKGRYGCCGFGGDTAVASPEFAQYVTQQRAYMDERPYITYCSNCRDVFLGQGKLAVHMLDLLFGINDMEEKQPPTYTKRRRNREELKRYLMERYWREKMTEIDENDILKMSVDVKIAEKLQKLRLVEDDIRQVIETCNRLKRRVYDKEQNTYTCYAKLNYITCWVVYRLQEDTHHIVNVYTHRMDIKLEETWNGKKINLDL